MAIESFNSESKNLIRSEWCKGLIRFLHDELKSKLVYLGLPSPDAEDVMEWLEYISEVLAFQCRTYPEASHESQSREEVEKLERKLEELERKGFIENFVVYDGYMEEVLVNKKDNMQVDFIQDNTIHIYNFDFCNNIQSPREVVDNNGNVIEVRKFDAIESLLKIQHKFTKNASKFVLFLTIKSTFNGEDLSKYINQQKQEHIKSYIKSLNVQGISKSERKKRLLRMYVIESLTYLFNNYNFKLELLPTIHYEGVNSHKLLHFTVMGTQIENLETQEINYELLKQKFICINNKEFVNCNHKNIEENITQLCSVESFKQTDTFCKIWTNNR